MDFQLGSIFIRIGLSKGKAGNMAKLVIVAPMGDKMFALRCEICNSAMPVSSDQIVYNRDLIFAENIVKGWLSDAS